MKPTGSVLIKRSEVSTLLSLEDCISAVEQAFKLKAEGKAKPPGILGIHVTDGGFHIKAGALNMGRDYFVAKTNGNFPHNRTRNGLPTIQGIILVSDATNGMVLAVMDSMEITIIRTGAATAVAAKYLAKPDAGIATICGCGNQGRISLQALLKVRDLKKIFAFDTDNTIAKHFANELSQTFNVEIIATENLKTAMEQSDICITCTPSEKYFLRSDMVRPGTFIAAVGADSEHKQELEPALLFRNKVVVDSIEQCLTIGELHHAVKNGVMRREQVHAELGEIIAGQKEARTSANEIIIFDSTGTALQDVAAAAIVYENALRREIGGRINFAE